MEIKEEDYQKAVAVVRKSFSGSVSNIQRKLYWGYSRAASAVDRMQNEFIVSPMSASGRREVYPEAMHELWKELQAAKKQATPEGFVLVPKDQITCFWQDNDEPENFCNSPSDFDSLGDCIDLGDIMQINKHTQANIGTEKLYGTWVADAGNPLERSRSKFFVGTESECEEIVLENERVFEEAQEQSHD